MGYLDTIKDVGSKALNVATFGASGAVQGAFKQKPIVAYDPNSAMFDPTAAQQGAGLAQDYGTTARVASANAQGRQFVDPAQADAARQMQLSDRSMAQGSRSQQLQDIQGIRDFINEGPGPSAAQAQLQQAQSRNMADAISLARSGRGGRGSAAAMNQAQSGRARIAADTASSAAQLRANEATAWRGQQLQGMGLAQSGMAGVRGADLGQQQVSAGVRAGDQAQQGIALNQAGLNDAYAVNQGQLGLGYANLGRGYTADAAALMAEEERLRAQNQMAARTDMAQYDAQRDAALIGGIGALGGAAIAKSDRDAKTDIEEIKGILDTAKNAKPYKYKYKDERDGKGEFVGPMAQDLEKTPLGNTLVRKIGGKRFVDGARSGMVALSALGEQQREIEAIKKLLDKGKRAA